jgi:hypothetical protein
MTADKIVEAITGIKAQPRHGNVFGIEHCTACKQNINRPNEACAKAHWHKKRKV